MIVDCSAIAKEFASRKILYKNTALQSASGTKICHEYAVQVHEDGDSGLGSFNERGDPLEWTHTVHFWKGTYTESILTELQAFKGRFRVMLPSSSMQLHVDRVANQPGGTYHIPIFTDKSAFIISPPNAYHYPADGRIYHLDTLQPHLAVNGSLKLRIHLTFGRDTTT